ncbi:chemotaxis protein CheC [[Clostridium] polysaccharolyticum]|uniref:Chemotaxis protein CheC n=1 Tax=[Clostridium] polysaccharolyticum TaxID=29364 RepID=A0A1H9Y2T8_9FIRM|nr:chemotaxis protein CheC [[Clostridium] polysaccharolyticum]SES63152.1 chemotaxis protein CheC [[Clostridium] polysaccharolyticum]
MSKLDLEHMGSMEYDVLREIGNIGAGNATTALSQMVNLKIDMKVPKVELLEFKELSDIVGGAESLVVGILLTLEGDIDGMMMFMMDKCSARHIVNLLMNLDLEELEVEDFSEMDLSALQEIGNIIAGAYLSSLSQLTNMTIMSSVPYLSIDMAGAILSVPAIEFGKVGDKALLIQSQFGEKEKEVNGYFILIPSMNSYEKIMSSLGL